MDDLFGINNDLVDRAIIPQYYHNMKGMEEKEKG